MAGRKDRTCLQNTIQCTLYILKTATDHIHIIFIQNNEYISHKKYQKVNCPKIAHKFSVSIPLAPSNIKVNYPNLFQRIKKRILQKSEVYNKNLRNRKSSTIHKPYNKVNATRTKTKRTETNRTAGKCPGNLQYGINTIPKTHSLPPAIS